MMIEVKGLAKTFGGFQAVSGLSFSVPQGQVLGFLGPNGAGKSTTMKMLTGFIEPSAGTATIGGKDIVRDSLAVRQLIGYLPESAPSYSEMTVAEFLGFIAAMRSLRGAEAQHAIHKMRDWCFLGDVWHQAIETLSKGYRQRVGFAQALLHDPPVLILDEPTDGLDPNQKHEVRELIRRLGANKTIILSTHILEEVEAICARVLIIARGQLVADASPLALMEKSRLHNAVSLRFVGGSLPSDAEAALQRLPLVAGLEPLPLVPGWRVLARAGAPVVASVAELVHARGWQVEQLSVEQGRLDEVFRHITRTQA